MQTTGWGRLPNAFRQVCPQGKHPSPILERCLYMEMLDSSNAFSHGITVFFIRFGTIFTSMW